MNYKLENEIHTMICKTLDEFRKFNIEPIYGTINSLRQQINCMKNNHATQVVHEGKLICNSCNEVLGKIVDKDAVCKEKKR